MLGSVFAAMSLALVGYGFANVFSQIVAIFAAILTRVPGVDRRIHRRKRSDTNQKRQTPPKHERGSLHDTFLLCSPTDIALPIIRSDDDSYCRSGVTANSGGEVLGYY
jgi:hypothetical protein